MLSELDLRVMSQAEKEAQDRPKIMLSGFAGGNGLRCFLGVNNEERGQDLMKFECAPQSSWCIKRTS
eukprot:snap_masked-scaffold2181_size19268-processed-gene-0.1 protein:Tk09773 transcript:snap_masked-scaffold2181_size19268-processed-gene-0.1-mRNA-1 annotation:"3-carboxy- -muconate cycloisomerase"